MRRNWLITSLLLLLGGVVFLRFFLQFGYPLITRAQTPGSTNVIGPHAAFFDPAGNIKIIGMAGQKASTDGTPITVMVDINASVDDINSIMNALSGNQKLKPTVRIVGVNSSTMSDTSKASQIATNINQSNIPSGTLVVLGNELNNLAKEWGNSGDTLDHAGAQYGNAFRTFQQVANSGGKFTAVPAPPDMYNGDYDWSTFVSSSGVYGGTLVANVYDLPNTPGLEMYKQLPGTVVAFTEYGPHPDKSLQEHINFYKTHTPPVPATTLVPDKCSGKPDIWLYYIEGKIYDAEGNEVDPSSCSTSSNRGEPPAGDYYKRFVYPFYSQSFTTDQIVKKLEESYSVACANPANYSANIAGDIKKLSEEQRHFSPSAIFSLDASGTNRIFGVLRNETEAKWRAYDAQQEGNAIKRSFTNRWESVEQWLGANNPPEVAYSNKTPNKINYLHQAPYYKLSTLEAQCLAQGEVLTQRMALCNQWSALPENAGKPCSLVTQNVQSSGKTYQNVYDEFNSVGGASFCEKMFSDSRYQPTANDELVASDMNKVDLFMETAYRPAFIVLVTQVDQDGSTPPQRLVARETNGSTGKQIVDYLVYHVPDTISDQNPNSQENVPDVATRTVNTFMPLEITENYFNNWQADREILTSQVQAAKSSPLPTIDCHGGTCDEKLARALIDFINGYAMFDPSLQCGNTPTEKTEVGTKIGSQLAPNDSPEGLTKADAKTNISIKEYRDENGQVIQPRGDANQTRIYNIAPFGGRTEYVAESFNALFASVQQEKQFDDDKYFPTFEALFGETLNSQPDTKFYSEYETDENGNSVPVSKSVSDTISVQGTNYGARFPFMAKIFNLSTRGTVQQVASTGQALLECARKVADPRRNTEDFLLNCSSRGVAVGSGSSNGPNQYTDFATEDFDPFEIQYWNGSYLTFTPPPTIVWDAVKEAADRHGGDAVCDPFLVLAVAHSESPNFTNHDTENGATAMGVWQFTRGNWIRGTGVWDLQFFKEDNHHNPINYTDTVSGRFDCTNPSAEGTLSSTDACTRTNIYAAADAACRFMAALGLNDPAGYADANKFTTWFSSHGNNDYGRIWNAYPPQGEYVWRLWHALKDSANREKYKNIGDRG